MIIDNFTPLNLITMRRYILLLLLVTIGTSLAAQTDSTTAVMLRLYNTLGSKDKIERNKYKATPAEIRAGSLGNTSVYKSTISIPGFSNPEFVEGGGSTRMFTTFMEFGSYEKAVKAWDELNRKVHNDFTGGWTFTETDEPRELYRSAKLSRDGSLMSPVIRYRVERSQEKFRLVLEITY